MDKELTDKQWWKLCDAHGGRPFPLTNGEVPKSFVYYRTYGVFPCAMGSHPGVMSLLLAWHHGLNCGIDVAEKLELEFSRGTADRFLTMRGTAFRSSQGERVEAWEQKNLEEWEIAILGDVRFIGHNVEVSSRADHLTT